MRSRGQIEGAYRRYNDRYTQILKIWAKINSEWMNGNVYVMQRWNHSKRDAIERWIASAAGTIRTMRWILGIETFGTAMSTVAPEEVTDLRLTNDWGKDGDKRVAPLGAIPSDINDEHTPSQQLRPEQWLNFMYHHTVAIHREIYNLHRFHPGKWHPMFMQRVVNTLFWFDGSIRVLEWSLAKCDDNHAFYAFEDDVLEQVEKALQGTVEFDQNLLARYTVAPDDHDPDKDFGSQEG